jgi:very-short-patch-repair endonuclease
MMAAALHFKGNALIAGRAAARHWGLLDTTQRLRDDDPIDVLLVGRNAARVRGVRIHRTSSLPRRDVRWRQGIPVVSPARALLEMAARFDDLELEAATLIAFRRWGVRASHITDLIARHPRAKGVARLRMLTQDTGSLRDTRSEYERRLRRLIAAAGLPAPLSNSTVAGHMVDMLWPELKLVVEFDGWEFHGRRSSFEVDRIRDQDLAAAAHQVVRVTARQIDDTPYALVARLSSVIAGRRLSR